MSEQMKWERYETAVPNRQNQARFLLGERVVFSGYAPHDEINERICKAYNSRPSKEQANG